FRPGVTSPRCPVTSEECGSMTSQPATALPELTPVTGLPATPASNLPRAGMSVPQRTTRPRRRGKILLVGGLAFAAVASAVVAPLAHSFRHTRTDLVVHPVRYGRLELTVVERGSLESSENRDVYCRVKAGQKNSTVATTIKSVIDDGSHVKKGDLLV